MVSIHNSSELLKSARCGGDAPCLALLPVTQQPLRELAQQPKPVHRDTVTNCESLPLDRVPSPRVKRGEIRAASGLQHDTADAWGVVPRVLFGDVCACRLACLVCVLTAQLPSACIVQRGIAPLERVLGLVRGRVEGTMKSSIMFSHSLALIFTRVGTRCKCASSHQKPSKCR